MEPYVASHSDVLGPGRCSALYKQQSININPTSNHEIKNSVLPAICVRVMKEKACGSDQLISDLAEGPLQEMETLLDTPFMTRVPGLNQILLV